MSFSYTTSVYYGFFKELSEEDWLKLREHLAPDSDMDYEDALAMYYEALTPPPGVNIERFQSEGLPDSYNSFHLLFVVADPTWVIAKDNWKDVPPTFLPEVEVPEGLKELATLLEVEKLGWFICSAIG